MTIETGSPAIYQSAPSPSSLSPTVPVSKLATTHPRQFTREFDFLLLCASCNHDSKSHNIQQFGDDLDWQTFLRIIEHHRLIPQVYSILRDYADFVPKSVLENLYARYQANVRQTLRLTRDLVRVLKHFESCGIPVLSYKGPALATLLHGDVTVRQFADLDFLVHPSAVQNSTSALKGLGYKPQCVLGGRQEESYIQSGYEYAFDLPDAQNILELKWAVLPRFYSVDFDIAGFFDRAVMVEVSSYRVLTLCPEDLLLVLCVHAAKHAWSELSLLWDISQLVQSRPINWDVCYEQATRLGIRRILNVNLALVRALLGNPLPSGFPRRLETEIGIAVPRVFSVIAKSEQVNTETVAYFRLMFSLREHWQDRVRLLWRLLATPGAGEWSVVSLPPWLFPFYHAVRMFRLAARLMSISITERYPASTTEDSSAAI